MRIHLIVVGLLICFSVHAADFYVTESGAGARNGADWNTRIMAFRRAFREAAYTMSPTESTVNTISMTRAQGPADNYTQGHRRFAWDLDRLD